MTKWLFLIIMALILPARTEAAPALLVFGDSLSAGYGLVKGEGWVDLLAEKLQGKYRVVNLSQSGETAFGGAARIEEALAAEKPAIVIVELGANDGLRGVAVAEIRNSLESIILACKKKRARILLVGMRLPPNYGSRYGTAFSAIYPELAKQYRVALVPFMMQGFAEKMELFQADAMHPNKQAQPLVLENIWKGLSPLL